MTSLMHAFVISLENSTRVSDLKARLVSLGFDVADVTATDGRALSDAELKSLAVPQAGSRLYGERLSPAQIGCHLSHREAYRQFAATGGSWALIAEDDSFPLDGLSSVGDLIQTWTVTSPTVVECFNAGRVNPGKTQVTVTEEVSLDRLVTFPGSTVTYFINREAALLALQDSSPVISRADWPQWAADVEFWRTRPNVVLHGAPGTTGESTMTVERRRESRPAKVARWAGLLTGVTYLRLRTYYPGGWGQYYRHAVKPTLTYWVSQARLVRGRRR